MNFVNIDKHRALMLTAVFLQDWTIYLSQPNSILAEVVFTSADTTFRDLTVIAKVPFHAVSDPETVQMYLAQRKFVVAFTDRPPSSTIDSVDVTLNHLIEFVKTDVLRKMAPYVERSF